MPTPRSDHARFRIGLLMPALFGLASAAAAAPVGGVPSSPAMAAGEPPSRAARPASGTPAVRRPPQPRQGIFSFEAERVAMQNGCTTRDGVRPAGFLVRQGENAQIYEVECGRTRMQVRCQFEDCRLTRPR